MVKYCWRLHLAEIVITLLSGCWRFFREQTNIIWPVCNLFEGFWSNFCSHALVASLWEEVRGFCVADSPHLIWSPTPREHFSRRQPLAFAFTHSLFHWITESDIPHCKHWLDLLPSHQNNEFLNWPAHIVLVLVVFPGRAFFGIFNQIIREECSAVQISI